MLRRHITCQLDRRRVSSTINVEAAWPRGLTSGSARWLTSRTVGHVGSSTAATRPEETIYSKVATVGSDPHGKVPDP
jgi:hypothetical protein